jgi:hypothetical protein
MDVVTGAFYLGTYSQEKVCKNDMRDVSPDMMESILFVFVKIDTGICR